MKNKRFKTLLCALICLFISTASALTFVVLSQENNESLSLAVDSLAVYVGESSPIAYELNLTEANITFETADPNIAIVDENKIYGIQVGKTILRATATFQGQVSYSSCEIIVKSKEDSILPKTYTHDIFVKSGAIYLENILYLQGTASFEIKIQDNSEKSISVDNMIIRKYSEGISITKQFCSFFMSASKSGYVDFYLPEIHYEFTVNVVI